MKTPPWIDLLFVDKQFREEMLGGDSIGSSPKRPQNSLFDENGQPKKSTIVILGIILILFAYAFGVMQGQNRIWREAEARGYAKWNIVYKWDDKWVGELQFENSRLRTALEKSEARTQTAQ